MDPHGVTTIGADGLLTPHASRLMAANGIALLTTMLLLVAMTVIGIAAMTVTGLGSKMAGYGRSEEAGASAAEACLGTAVKIVQDTLEAHMLPPGYRSDANPAGPVPAGNAVILEAEIMGQSDNNSDVAEAVPNTVTSINNYTVNGDIDRLYRAPKAGSAQQPIGGGYDGAGASAIDIYYRIDCMASNAITDTRGRITAIYACTQLAGGETCQRKI